MSNTNMHEIAIIKFLEVEHWRDDYTDYQRIIESISNWSKVDEETLAMLDKWCKKHTGNERYRVIVRVEQEHPIPMIIEEIKQKAAQYAKEKEREKKLAEEKRKQKELKKLAKNEAQEKALLAALEAKYKK